MASMLFVNTTDSPTLGLAESKRMRAHITRTNFANRRRKLVEQKQEHDRLEQEAQEIGSHQKKSYSPPQIVPETKSQSALLTLDWCYDLAASPSSDSAELGIKHLLSEFRPVVFPSGNGDAGSHNERMWIQLFLSEPALVEASLSINWGHHPRGAHMGRSHWHAYRAVKFVNERLADPRTSLEDGVLATVFTLGYRESLVQNRQAKMAHVNGLSQMLKLRRDKGEKEIPNWFHDLILYEAMTESIASPWTMGETTAYLLDEKNLQMTRDMSKVSSAVGMLTDPINAYHQGILYGEEARLMIQRQVDCLHRMIQPLFLNQGSYVRTLAHSLRIFLYLIWPPVEDVDLAHLASELRCVLMEPYMKLCSSIQLTVWQFFTGAVAAGKDTEDRAWFRDCLLRLAMKSGKSNWDSIQDSLKKTFLPDDLLQGAYKHVWLEVMSRWSQVER